MDELSEKVIEALSNITDEGEVYNFTELIKAVAEPGECYNCLTSPVKRVLTKLLEQNRLTFSFKDS